MSFLPDLPMYLYKFRSFAPEQRSFTWDILEHNRLWWATPASFNDPFDCAPVPVWLGSKLKREAAARRIVRKHAMHLPKPERRRMIKAAGARPPSDIENKLAILNAEVRSEIGVCSFSERFDHLLMWAHYADAHKGICLRFRTSSDLNFHFSLALPVKYSAQRPVINVLDYDNDTLLDLTLLAKADFWAYEREWRLMDQHRSGLHNFPPECLDGVILGALMAEADKTEVTDWAMSRGHPVEVLQAELDERLYEMRAVPPQQSNRRS